jgi:hypothetical protein
VVPRLVLIILGLGVSFFGLSLWVAYYTGSCYVLGNLLCSCSSIKVAPEVCGGEIEDSPGT